MDPYQIVCRAYIVFGQKNNYINLQTVKLWSYWVYMEQKNQLTAAGGLFGMNSTVYSTETLESHIRSHFTIFTHCVFPYFFAKELKQAQINQIHQYGKTTGQITGTVFHCSGCSSFKARALWCLYCNPLPQNLQLPFGLFSTMKQQCEGKFRTRFTHK